MKARIVRHQGRGKGSLTLHVSYIEREGVGLSGEKGRAFNAVGFVEEGEKAAWLKDAVSERHHFRFIVSPENSSELDLEWFAKRFMAQAEEDLGTKLKWLGVVHRNTDNGHVHFIVRGSREDGKDLVMSRDYISRGLRAAGASIVTRELGPRTEVEYRREITKSVTAERFTVLDRRLLALSSERQVGFEKVKDDEPLRKRVGVLSEWGLVRVGQGYFELDEKLERSLRKLGAEGDIVKRLNEGLTRAGLSRGEIRNWSEGGSNAQRAFHGEVLSVRLTDELSEQCAVTVRGESGEMVTVITQLGKVRGFRGGQRVFVSEELLRGSIRARVLSEDERWVSVRLEGSKQARMRVQQFEQLEREEKGGEKKRGGRRVVGPGGGREI